ncbi:MAG: CBS domain-containing protein, partial [Verrucomicrobiota bacterium]
MSEIPRDSELAVDRGRIEKVSPMEIDGVSEDAQERLSAHVEERDGAAATRVLEEVSAEEIRHAVAHLSHGEQATLFELLTPEDAARLVDVLPEALVMDLLQDVPPGPAADILNELTQEVSASLLRDMETPDAEAVFAELDPEEEEKLRELTEYRWDSAGGLMSTNYASFSREATVEDILEALTQDAEKYSDYDVQYVYVTAEDGTLAGVLRLRDLVLSPRARRAHEILIQDPVTSAVEDDLETLVELFTNARYVGLPVVDPENRLVGVITENAVREASAEQQTEDYLNASGIVGGEEIRSMRLQDRCLRRLAWLAPNIVLNLIAASVIGLYEDTLQAAIALAMFLPIVSDMSGCSGNQAVAVSIRELTLGILRPTEFW